MPAAPPRKTKEDVSEALGSYQHWIQRSPLEDAVLGTVMDRATNQLKLLLKKAVAKAERNAMESHLARVHDAEV